MTPALAAILHHLFCSVLPNNPILVDHKSHHTQIPLTTILKATKMVEPRDVITQSPIRHVESC
jgi:hypothetical protein